MCSKTDSNCANFKINIIQDEILSIFEQGNVQKFYKLIEDGLDPNARFEGNGCTILHLAVGIDFPQKVEVVRFLLARGADPNARCEDGLTPVHISSMWGNTVVLDLLLQMGGDVWQRDDLGKCAIDMAVESCEHNCVEVLKKYQCGNSLSKTESVSSLDDVKIPRCHRIDEDRKDNSLLSSQVRGFDFAKSTTCTQNGLLDSTNETVQVLYKTDALLEENVSEFGSDLRSESSTELNKGFCGSCCLETTMDSGLCRNSKPDSDLQGYSVISFTSSDVCDAETEIVHTDEESGTVLLEKKFPSTYLVGSGASSGAGSSDSALSNTSLEPLSNTELRQELLRIGESPGPITSTTRQVYIERLRHIRNGDHLSPTQGTLLQGYASELAVVMHKKFFLKDMLALEEELNADFDIPDEHKKWREGTQKAFFNYLLLDPSITHNLPLRSTKMSFTNQFISFIKAIFYVGKGKRTRPYCHLFEALRTSGKKKQKEVVPKIATILKIWQTGKGVVSLHCFQNTIACEAFTREACIIEVLGLQNLTNAKKGEFYGAAQRWTTKQKKMFGAYLLYRAFHVFLYEGERQLRPADVVA